MLELEPFAWRTLKQEELDLTSLKAFISTLSSYLEFEIQQMRSASASRTVRSPPPPRDN